MKKIIKLTENQILTYIHTLNEAFTFRTDKESGKRIMSYKPGVNSKIDDTIFNADKSLKVKEVKLPKSNVISYNLYDIKDINVNKVLKHGVDSSGEEISRDNNIILFLKRSVLLIKHIIGNKPVDVIVSPQSSSPFNNEMINLLKSYYPNSEGISIKPDLLTKNVRGITINYEAAQSVGLTDEEIETLQRRINKWGKEEDIRDKRREIERITNEIRTYIENRQSGNKGRLPKKYEDMKKETDNLRNDIGVLRKGMMGKDPTINQKTGKVKDWQIKSLEDRYRRAIENIFQLNPIYEKFGSKLKGKHVIIFDDNLSSGATMDEACVTLLKLGVASVIPFTLGVIAPTIYDIKEKQKYKEEHGLLPKTHRVKKEPPFTDVDGTYHLGYKIIKLKDGGYNLMTKSGNMIFNGNPPLEIEYNTRSRMFIVKTNKFTFKGRPGNWKKIES